MLADCGAQGERVWARHPGTAPPSPRPVPGGDEQPAAGAVF